jgi:ankyrin repeat protein
MVHAVRTSDLDTLKLFHSQGKSMSACNKYSESIVHMACRRSEFDMVDFIVRNGGDIGIIDDYGRTPLHDACWRSAPRFDIVTLLLDRQIDLLRMSDVRGANPLKYVCKDHWLAWCAYFFHQKEKYWPVVESKATSQCHPNSVESVSECSSESDSQGANKKYSSDGHTSSYSSSNSDAGDSL